MSRHVVSLAATFVAVFAISPYIPPAAASEPQTATRTDAAVARPHPEVLRPMSQQTFDAACKEEGYARGVTTVGTDAYSIRCVNEDGSLQTFRPPEEIHDFVARACQGTYTDTRVTDRLATMGRTYSAWECADYGSYAGTPDLKKWCESKGLTLVSASSAKYSAYQWFCANSSGTTVEGIPVDDVCASQFDESALDRVFNVYGKTVEDAWDCFYTR